MVFQTFFSFLLWPIRNIIDMWIWHEPLHRPTKEFSIQEMFNGSCLVSVFFLSLFQVFNTCFKKNFMAFYSAYKNIVYNNNNNCMQLTVVAFFTYVRQIYKDVFTVEIKLNKAFHQPLALALGCFFLICSSCFYFDFQRSLSTWGTSDD